MSEMLGSEYAREFIRVRQGYDQLVESMAGTVPHIPKGQNIVDFNLTGMWDPMPFSDFTSVQYAYEKLGETLPSDEQDRALIEERIVADQMSARMLQGEPVDYDESIKDVTGFSPQELTQDYIDQLRDDLVGAMSTLGYTYDPDGVQAYYDRYLLHDGKEIKQIFQGTFEPTQVVAARYVPVTETSITPDKWYRNKKIPWSGHISTDRDGNVVLLVNTHPNLRHTVARIALWSLHEVGGHKNHMDVMRSEIQQGAISPAVGLTSMLSPENTFMELQPAFTESLMPEFARTEEERAVSDIELAHGDLFMAVLYNAAIRVSRERVTKDFVEQTIDEAAQDVLFMPRARHETLIKAAMTQPTYRGALLTYAQVRLIMDPVIVSDDNDQRRTVMHDLYRKALTVAQAKQLVEASFSE